DYRRKGYSNNGDSDDNGEKSWMSNKTIHDLRHPNYSSKRFSILPFRKTPTGASTDDDTIDNNQSIKEKKSSPTETRADKSIEKIKGYTPNPFKLLRRFHRSLSMNQNNISEFSEGGVYSEGRHRAEYVIEKGSDKVGSLVWHQQQVKILEKKTH